MSVPFASIGLSSRVAGTGTSARLWRFCVALLALTPCLLAQLTLSQWIPCVGAGGSGSTCQLAKGQYTVGPANASGCSSTQHTPTGMPNTSCGTITIGRSNVTVKGTFVTSREDTTLQRATNLSPNGDLLCNTSSCNMLAVGVAGQAPLSGVVIMDMALDGNNAHYTTCQTNTGGCGGVADLTVVNVTANQSQWPPTTPGLGLTVRGVDFLNAPGHAMSMHNFPVADVWIFQSFFSNATTTGIHADFGTINMPTQCDSSSNWLTDPTDQLPRRILIQQVTFDNTHTGALGLQAINLIIDSNNFNHDYQQPVGGEPAGGDVFIDQCADTVSITNNTLHGLDDSNADKSIQNVGFELYGRNISITGSNALSNFSYEGITANGVFKLKIQSAKVTSGCEVFSVNGTTICPGIGIYNKHNLRAANGVTISGTTSQNSGNNVQANGIRIFNICQTINGIKVCGPTSMSNITITSDDILAPNRISAVCVDSSNPLTITGLSNPFGSVCP